MLQRGWGDVLVLTLFLIVFLCWLSRGQPTPDYVITLSPLGACQPFAVDVDQKNLDMWIVDNQNQRVLRYHYPYTGSPVSVLGQLDFNSHTTPSPTGSSTFFSPGDVTIDQVAGDLW